MSSELKITNIKHSSSGSNNLVLASDGTTTVSGALTASGGIANAGTITAGTLGSSVVFPAGTVLQVKSHLTTSTQNNTGSDTSYYVQSDGSIGTGSSSPWGNITLKKANSTLVYTIHASVYFHRSTGGGNFPSINWYMRYSTNSNLSSSTDTSSFANVYEDCRWHNYLSEQQKIAASGTVAVTSSHAKDTVVYYTVKADCRYSGVYPISLQVMELAT